MNGAFVSNNLKNFDLFDCKILSTCQIFEGIASRLATIFDAFWWLVVSERGSETVFVFVAVLLQAESVRPELAEEVISVTLYFSLALHVQHHLEMSVLIECKYETTGLLL